MSEDRESREPQLPRALASVFALAVGAAAIAVIAYMVYFSLYVDRGISTEPDAWGQFGDYLGGVMNPIIALGALLLLAVGVRIQNDTLREARKQLELQRDELVQTRAVLAQQSEQLSLQAEAAQREVFEATFFRLLESLRKLVDSTRYSANSSGAVAMFSWAVELRDYDGAVLRAANLTPSSAANFVAPWYATRRPQLSSYFSLVLMVLEFVEKNKHKDAVFYSDILSATLSPGELFLLFHYGLSDTRFKSLAEKYGLLDAFDPTLFDLSRERRAWYSAAGVPRDYKVRLA